MISGKHSTAHNTMTGKKKSERETKSVLERTRAIVSMETLKKKKKKEKRSLKRPKEKRKKNCFM